MKVADRRVAYTSAIVAGVVAVLVIVWLVHPLRYPFANDTAGYLQEAVNFVAGKGLRRWVGWPDSGVMLAPSPYFPPGYAIAIATAISLGLSPKAGALAIAWGAWALLVPAILFALRPIVSGTLIPILIGLIVVTSPGLYEWGYQALSDGPALLLSILCVGALLRGTRDQPHAWQWAVASGILAGMAYAVRNAAVILPITAIGSFAAATALGMLDFRGAARRACIWGLGFAAVLVPLLVRNVSEFGALQPYFVHHGATEYGWIRAIRVVLWSGLLDLSGSREVAEVAWNFKLILLIGLPIAAILVWVGVRFWSAASEDQWIGVITLGLFVVLGLAMVTVGRVRFDWVETTLTRYVMQYSWAILGLAVCLFTGPGLAAGAMRYSFLAILVPVFLYHIQYIQEDISRESLIAQAFLEKKNFEEAAASLVNKEWILTNQIRMAISRDIWLKEYITEIPQDVQVSSNFASTLYIETGRIVRPVQLFRAESTWTVQPIGTRRQVFVLLPTNLILRGPHPESWQTEIAYGLRSRVLVDKQTSNVLVMRTK